MSFVFHLSVKCFTFGYRNKPVCGCGHGSNTTSSKNGAIMHVHGSGLAPSMARVSYNRNVVDPKPAVSIVSGSAQGKSHIYTKRFSCYSNFTILRAINDVVAIVTKSKRTS